MHCSRDSFLSKRYSHIEHYLLVLVSILAPTGAINVALADTPARVEVFTTSEVQFVETVEGDEGARRDINLQIYELDGIQLAEEELSRNLTADPAQSKQILLQRIQGMDEQTMRQM